MYNKVKKDLADVKDEDDVDIVHKNVQQQL